MSSIPWVPSVRQVVNGQPINAQFTNTAIKDLIQRTDFLYDKSNSVEAAKLVLNNVASIVPGIDVSSVTDYDVVAFKESGGVMNLVKAAAVINDDSLFAAGVLLSGNVLAYGILDIPVSSAPIPPPSGYETYMLAPTDTDWVDGEQYYLYDMVPGKITAVPSASSPTVRIGYYLGDGKFQVDISVLAEFYRHRHITQELHATGITPFTVVTTPIIMSVSEAMFSDMSTFLFVNGKLAQYGVDYDVIVSGTPAIRWLWLTANVTPSDPAFNPRAFMISEADYLVLTFMLPTGTSVGVTSIVPCNENTFVTNCAGDPAMKGDLQICSISRFQQDSDSLNGCRVLKNISYSDLDDKIHYSTGPVVEKLIAGPGIVLENDVNCQPGQGILRVSANTSGAYDEIPAVALRNAKEGVIGLYPYVSLIKEYACGFLAKKKLNPAIDTTLSSTLLLDYFIPTVTSNKHVVLEISWIVTPPYDPTNGVTPALDIAPQVSTIAIALGALTPQQPNRPSRVALLTFPALTGLIPNAFLGLQVKRLQTNALDTYTGAFNIMQLGYSFNNPIP